MGISVKSVVQYFCTQVGEGSLRRSDVLFSISKDDRDAFEEGIQAAGPREADVRDWLQRNRPNVNDEDLVAYLVVRDARIALGDMYELLSGFEKGLHSYVRLKLIEEYGDDRWWRDGVPEGIRAECASLRERDVEPSGDPFKYTTLIHLKEIFDKRWDVLSKGAGSDMRSNKKKFLSDLDQLNRVRNRVMHPVRDCPPTEQDFAFLWRFLRSV
jgi:hypothetical protein